MLLLLLDFQIKKGIQHGEGASAKLSPLPWRAGGKKQPVSPGAAYRAASTNSESPYWRSGVVLPQDPLELFGMPLQIVRSAPSHGGHPDDLVEVPMLPPDHYGCGLGCARFTGTLAAVEEHERGCAHSLHDLLPEGLQRDLFSGDEDERALTLLDIVEPLQYPLSVLHKARRHALASPLSSLLRRCRRWSRPIDTRRLRRSYQRRDSRPRLQCLLLHTLFCLLRLLSALYL